MNGSVFSSIEVYFPGSSTASLESQPEAFDKLDIVCSVSFRTQQSVISTAVGFKESILHSKIFGNLIS